MEGISGMDDIQNLFKETIAKFMQNGLKVELDDELGYSSKTLHTSFDEVAVHQEHKGEFELQLLKKIKPASVRTLRKRYSPCTKKA